MKILGIETSCDECSAAVVADGRDILSNEIATQIELHKPYNGVVPEIASRLHTEWITSVVQRALDAADTPLDEIQGIAVTSRPGLVGSLLVGLNFAKAVAFARDIPFVGVDHIRAHLYAPHLEFDITYPFLGVLVSGGHTVICKVSGFDDIEVLGTTIDDAIGEAFDKVAKFYDMGFPGGVAVDKLARQGDSGTFDFPDPSLHKGSHQFDVSYSGLKTAVINQADQFYTGRGEKTKENIAASFQHAAVEILMRRIRRALKATGLKRVVAGGGVAANSQLRSSLKELDAEVIFPSLKLCTDNGAMIAGIGYQYLQQGRRDPYSLQPSPRVQAFKRTYPIPS